MFLTCTFESRLQIVVGHPCSYQALLAESANEPIVRMPFASNEPAKLGGSNHAWSSTLAIEAMVFQFRVVAGTPKIRSNLPR